MVGCSGCGERPLTPIDATVPLPSPTLEIDAGTRTIAAERPQVFVDSLQYAVAEKETMRVHGTIHTTQETKTIPVIVEIRRALGDGEEVTLQQKTALVRAIGPKEHSFDASMTIPIRSEGSARVVVWVPHPDQSYLFETNVTIKPAK